MDKEMASLSDEQLMMQVVAGSAAASTELVVRFTPRMRAMASRILRHTEDAEDAVQEAWLKIFTHGREFRFHSALRTWIYRVTWNEALMAKRRRDRHRQVDQWVGARPYRFQWLQPPNPGPAEVFRQRELEQLVEQALDTVNPKRRKAFLMCVVHGIPPSEAAAMLGLTTLALKSRLSSARKNVRAYLATHDNQAAE